MFKIIKVFRFQRKTIWFFFTLLFFILLIFSQTRGQIFIKFLTLVVIGQGKKLSSQILIRHLRFEKYPILISLIGHFVQIKMGKERHLKFSCLRDRRLKLCNMGSKCLKGIKAPKRGRTRKWSSKKRPIFCTFPTITLFLKIFC